MNKKKLENLKREYPPKEIRPGVRFLDDGTPVDDPEIIHSWGSELLEWAEQKMDSRSWPGAVFQYNGRTTHAISLISPMELSQIAYLLMSGKALSTQIEIMYGATIKHQKCRNSLEMGKLQAMRNMKKVGLWAIAADVQPKISDGGQINILSVLFGGLFSSQHDGPIVSFSMNAKTRKSVRVNILAPSAEVQEKEDKYFTYQDDE